LLFPNREDGIFRDGGNGLFFCVCGCGVLFVGAAVAAGGIFLVNDGSTRFVLLPPSSPPAVVSRVLIPPAGNLFRPLIELERSAIGDLPLLVAVVGDGGGFDDLKLAHGSPTRIHCPFVSTYSIVPVTLILLPSTVDDAAGVVVVLAVVVLVVSRCANSETVNTSADANDTLRDGRRSTIGKFPHPVVVRCCFQFVGWFGMVVVVVVDLVWLVCCW